MAWLVAIVVLAPLGFWVWRQQGRIDALTRRIAELESRLAGVKAPATAAAESAPQPAPPPMLLDAAAEDEPLLLDTPLPTPSNDTNGGALPPQDEDVLVLTDVAPPEEDALLLTQVAPPEDDAPAPFPPAAATPPPRVRLGEKRPFEQWLAENGLAWLAGGALAIAAIFLATFAAQQLWFTPTVRVAGMSVLGLALLGGSEWTRRISLQRPPGHPLVSAMLAGAGVVAFYAAAWAMLQFGLIGWGAATALLGACAALLIGLSFLHGQALAVLAVGMALMAPALAYEPLWPNLGFIGYIGAVGAAGFGVAALRRWAWVGAVTLAGLYFWFIVAISIDHVPRALALASLAAAGGLALAFRKPKADEAQGRLTWTRAHDYLPAVAISLSSALLLWTWLAIAPLPSGEVAGPAWVSTMFVALAASAVRARAAPPATLAVAILALAAGFVTYLRARFFVPTLGADFYPFVLFASIAIVASAIYARPHRSGRVLIAAMAALGAALLTAVAAFSRPSWHHVSAWLPLFVGAATLFGAAWLSARDAQDARSDRATAIWCAGAAALLFLGLESALADNVRTIAYGGAAVLLIVGFAWRGWSILRAAALAAAALCVGHALSTAGATLGGALPLGAAMLILATTAALLFAASYLADRAEPQAMAGEALSSAALFVVLTALFVALRWFAAGSTGTPIDDFTETSLRVLALLAAGHLVLPRGPAGGRINAWRGHVLIGVGLLYALLVPGLVINPWWGSPAAHVVGPFLLDTSTLAFALPAVLAFGAASRLYADQRGAARFYAAAGGALVVIWAVLLVRRLFHGAAMAQAEVGLFEAACYALLFLAAAIGLAAGARSHNARDPDGALTRDAVLVARAAAWFAVLVSVVLMLFWRHPWWGAQDPASSNAFSTVLSVLSQPLVVVLALVLGRWSPRAPGRDLPRFASAALAIVFSWSFGHAAVRWLYHRGYMDEGAPLAGLEGVAHALWPLALVLGGAALTARAPHRDTVRPYVHDLQAIWAAAIWPALAFAALGLWLLFNPWWGAAPAPILSATSAALAVAAFAAAAWLSAMAPRTPRVTWPESIKPMAVVAAVGHVFIGATLAVRLLYHSAAVNKAPVTDFEVWVYSAVWAVLGAGLFWLGMRRNDALQRWLALAALVATWIYAVLLAALRLEGLARGGSLVGLAIVLLVVAWWARANRLGAPPGPGDLLRITPAARRERRHGRRQRSQ